MNYVHRVFVTGPPAAGKTTFLPTITKWLTRCGMRVQTFSIEQCVRELFLRDTRDVVIRDGALILLKPQQQIPKAITLLASKCSAAVNTVVELADEKIVEVLVQDFRATLDGSLVFFLTAPLHVRLCRNASRTGDRMPTEVVRRAAEYLSQADIRLLESQGAVVSVVETDADHAQIEQKITDALAFRFGDRIVIE